MNLFQIGEHITVIGCAKHRQNITKIKATAKPMTTMTTTKSLQVRILTMETGVANGCGKVVQLDIC